MVAFLILTPTSNLDHILLHFQNLNSDRHLPPVLLILIILSHAVDLHINLSRGKYSYEDIFKLNQKLTNRFIKMMTDDLA